MTAFPYQPEHRNAAVAAVDGRLIELQMALAQPELSAIDTAGIGPEEGGAADKAAFHLAAALGAVRLAALESPEADGVLPGQLALAALRGMKSRAEVLAARAADLPRYMDEAGDDEGASRAASLLRGAFELFSAEVAVDEAYSQVLNMQGANQAADTLDRAFKTYAAAWDALDATLAANAECLTIVCDTALLTNLRAKIVAEDVAVTPWWLAGELEELAQEQQDAMLAALGRLRAPRSEANRVTPPTFLMKDYFPPPRLRRVQRPMFARNN